MALVPADVMGASALVTLEASHKPALRELLERDPCSNLFALSWLENYGVAPARAGVFHFRGILLPDGALEAMALVISDRLILMAMRSPDEALSQYLGQWYCEAAFHFQHIVSTRCLVGPFWDAYVAASHHTGASPIDARLISPQKMYVISRQRWLELRQRTHAAQASPIPLREATLADLDAVFFASARMHLDETLENPLEHQPDVFRSHVRHRIETGRTYVWFDAHRRLLFKADISAQSRYGVQISGVYTEPNHRNQGIASRAMIELCRLLFARGWPRVTLYVNHDNAPAIKVYERVGFSFHEDYMTVFVAP